METFYGGIDLHAKNAQVCVIDEKGVRVKERKLENNLAEVLACFEPFGKGIRIAIESTVNWYWIVDGLMGAGYELKLAHPLGLKLITEAKIKTDKRDAYKLANLLRLGGTPCGAHLSERDEAAKGSPKAKSRSGCPKGKMLFQPSDAIFAVQHQYYEPVGPEAL